MRRWSESDRKELLNQIKKHPENLQVCFLMTSAKIGRTRAAVKQYWYTILSKERSNTCFFIATEKRAIRNRKNSKANEKIKKGIWQKVISLLGF